MAKQSRRKAQQRQKNIVPWIWGVAALFIVGASAIWFLSQSTTQSNSYPQEVSVEEAAAKREAGAFILDVRQPEEWNEVHIPDATLIPLGELGSRVDELPRDQEIVVVCRSGNRSAQGRDILLEAGFTQVTSMAGGMIQWQAAGYPTVSGP
ncbi:MAG TPA: rhodanese-like domain-containing protein [Anaerolineales bacterium]|nr:rhodanese-like domain-containing protein [Anaerolineales bacterium]